jgi:hypothetical protein
MPLRVQLQKLQDSSKMLAPKWCCDLQTMAAAAELLRGRVRGCAWQVLARTVTQCPSTDAIAAQCTAEQRACGPRQAGKES